jgi:methyl-accepting chemotaxis protein
VVSFAPIRDDAGKIVGALLMGITINDQLAHVSAAIGNASISIATETQIVGSFAGKDSSQKVVLEAGAVAAAKAALSGGGSSFAEAEGVSIASARLESVGDGKRLAVVVAGPALLVDGLGALAYAVLGVSVLGLLMVVVAGFMLGTYISKPIDTLEEGLLAIINGQEDKRFNLEHPEFGGLGFRIDQLLNKLAGIAEDNTDAEGRVTSSSLIPAAAFRDVMMDRQPTLDADAVAARLAAEPADAYYARLFADYIEAKRTLGEATDHIGADTFRTRMQSMEQEARQKHGKAVRYQVQSDGKGVTLLAIPLP